MYARFAHPLQFQYIALWRYSMLLRTRLEETESVRDKLQSKIDAQEHRIVRLTAAIGGAQRETDELQELLDKMRRELELLRDHKAFFERKVEEMRQEGIQWDYWKARQAEITGYLNLLAPLARYARVLVTVLRLPADNIAESIWR